MHDLLSQGFNLTEWIPMSQYRVWRLAWFGICSNDISCSEENVYKQIFCQCAFTKLWVSNSWNDRYRSKTFSEFRKKRKYICPVQVSLKEQFLWPRKWILNGQVEKWKLVHLTSVTLTRCYLQTGNSFVPETEKSESWPPHHDDSGKVAYKHQIP